MAGNSRDLRILIRSELERTSKQTIINQLEDIKKKYGNLEIHIKIDQQALTALTNISNSINKITQTTQSQTQATNNAINAVIKETQAVKELTAEQIKYNVEKTRTTTAADKSATKTSTTSGNKFDNTTNSNTILNDGSIIAHPTVRNTDTAGLARKNAADALAIETKYAADFAKLLKDEEMVDKAHYQALKTVKDQALAMDKNHAAALKMNKEKYVKDLTRLLNQAEVIDRAHYNALKSNAARKEAMQKIETIAYQRNAQIDLQNQTRIASAKAQLLNTQNKAEREVLNLNRRYGNNIDNSQLNGLLSQLKGLTTASANYKTESARLSNEISKIGAAANSSTGSVINFGDAFKSALIRLPTFMLAGAIVRGFFTSFTSGVKSIYELDTAMTNLMKVTNASSTQYKEFVVDTNRVASSLGALTADVINATTEWARLGYSINQAKVLAAETIIYANVGDMDAETASKALISTIKGFGIQVDAEGQNVRKVVDIYNEVGNKFAISSAGIGEALRRSASSLKNSGNTIEESVALITASNATLQDPASVGTALKTVSMRLRGISEDGDDVSNLVPTLEKKFQSLGLSLKKDENTFKSTFEIMRDIAGLKMQGKLSDFALADITELVAGKRQGNIVTSLLDNWKDAEASLKVALSSNGSAARENAVYLDSIKAKVAQFKNEVVGFWNSAISSDGIKTLLVNLTSLVGVMGKVVSTFGLLPTLLTTIGISLLIFSSTARTAFVSFQSSAIKSALSASAGFSPLRTTLVTLATDVRILGVQMGLTTTQARVLGISVATALSPVAAVARAAVVGVSLLGRAFTITALAVKGFALSLASMALPILLITGVTMAIGALVSKHRELAEQQKAIEAHNKTITDSWSTQRDKVIALKVEYTSLHDILNKTAEQDARYLDVTDQLSKLMPNLVQSIDDKGNAHLKSAKAIEIELANAEKLTKLEQQRSLITAKKDFTSDVSNITDIQEKIQNTKDKMVYSSGNKEEVKNLEIQLISLESMLADAYDVAKTRVSSLTSNIATLAGIKVGVGLSDEFKKIADSLDVSSMSPATLSQKALALGGIITTLDKLKKASSMGESQALNNSFMEQTKSLNMTSVAAQELFEAYMKGDIILPEVSDNTDVYTASIKDMGKFIKETTKTLTPLNQAIRDVTAGNHLSSDSIADLVVQYPELATSIKVAADGYTIEADALEIVRKAKVDKYISDLEAENKSTKTTLDNTGIRIAAYGIELDGIKDVEDAKAKRDKIKSEQTKAKVGMFDKKESAFGLNPDLFKNNFIADQNAKNGDIIVSSLDKFIDDVGGRTDQIEALKLLLNSPDYGLGKPDKPKKDPLDQSPAANENKAEAIQRQDVVAGQIKAINEQRQATESLNESNERKIKIFDKEKDHQNSIKYTSLLIEGQTKLLNETGIANQKIQIQAGKFRNDLATDPLNKGKLSKEKLDTFFDANGEQSSAYIAYLDDIAKKSEAIVNNKNLSEKDKKAPLELLADQKKYAEDAVSSLYKLKQAYKTNAEAAVELDDKITANVSLNSQKQYDLLHQNLDKEISTGRKANEDDVNLAKLKFDLLKSYTVDMSQFTLDDQEKLNNEILDAKTEYDNTYFDHYSKLLEDKKSLDQLSVEDEIKGYKDIANHYQIGSENRIKADQKVHDAQKTLLDKTKEAFEKSIKAISDLEDERHDKRMDDLDAEMQKKEDSIDALKKGINNTSDTDTYNSDLAKSQKEAQDTQDLIDKYKLDTSDEGRVKTKELEKQHADQLTEIEKMQTERSKKLQLDALDDSLDAKKIEVDAAKNAENTKHDLAKKALDAITNDVTLWDTLTKGIFDGNAVAIGTSFDTLKTKLDGIMKDIGTGLTTNLTDPLQTAIDTANAGLGKDKTNAIANSGNASTNPQTTPSTPDSLTWQQKLAKAASDDAYAQSELDRAKKAYTDKKASGDIDGANAAHKYADQLRDANSSLPKFHEGGEIGQETSMGQKLHKLLNLGQGEIPMIGKVGEMVLSNPLSAIQNLMSRIKMPDLSGFGNKMNQSSGDKIINIDMSGMIFQGDKRGGETVLKTLVGGLQRAGYQFK